jgi:very-short-patch-repair endonuclease
MKYNHAIVLAYFCEVGLPLCVSEFRFHPERRWRFDFAWPDNRVALEVEGGAWTGGRHTRGSGFVKDMEKYNAATVLGWKILRVQPRDLTTKETTDMVKAIL